MYVRITAASRTPDSKYYTSDTLHSNNYGVLIKTAREQFVFSLQKMRNPNPKCFLRLSLLPP